MEEKTSSPGKPKHQAGYNSYLVTFIDIMGFKDFIEKEHEGDPEPILKIIKSFKKINHICRYRMCDDEHNKRVLVNFFSDSIIRRIPLDSLSDEDILYVLGYEMYQLALMQMTLISDGILIRGSMSMGKLYSQKEIFFGPAFHEAYESESKMAVYPIILLSASIENFLTKMILYLYMDDILTLYKGPVPFDCFNHGGIYINYLYLLLNARIFDKPQERDEFMAEHKKLIETSLIGHQHDYRVVSKYQWLKKYHNYYVPLMRAKNPDEYLIK